MSLARAAAPSAGFHPDPSIVEVDGVYTLVTSTFEYLPGLPVHRSTDLVTWELVGHVITRPEQAAARATCPHRAASGRRRSGTTTASTTASSR